MFIDINSKKQYEHEIINTNFFEERMHVQKRT